MPRKRSLGRGIVQRTDGRLCGTITMPSGKRKYVYSHKNETDRQFEERFDRLRQDARQNLPIASSRITLTRYLNEWIQIISSTSAPLSPVAYEDTIRRLDPHIGNCRLSKLTTMEIQRAYSALLNYLSPNTVQATHRMLHAALADAVKWGVLARNPATNTEVPKPPAQTMAVFTEEQVHHLIDATAGDRYHALWVLMVTTGMRHGEATGLLWSDVDLKTRTVTVQRTLQRHPGEGMVLKERPKTSKSRRTVMLSNGAVEALRKHRIQQKEEKLRLGIDWRGKDNLVFTNTAGGALDSRSIERVWYRTLIQVDLPRIRLHDLRHTAATLALKWGIHPKKVQEMLGHSSLRTTYDLYSHMMPTMHEEAAQRMDCFFQSTSA